MRIVRAETYLYDLPLMRPLVLPNGICTSRAGLLLRFENDSGAFAFGDAAPLPGFSRENIDETIRQALMLARALEGAELPPRLELVTDHFERWLLPFELVASLKFAVQSALLQLLAGEHDIPAFALAPHPHRSTIPVNGLLWGTQETVLERAGELLRAGYSTLKLKVGRETPQEDAQTVRALAALCGGRCALRLDANRAWDLPGAMAFAQAIEGCAIEYVEEPLQDPAALVEFAGRTGLPVALDETIVEHGEWDLEKWRGAAAAVLKPTLLGGFEIAMYLARKATNLGMTPVVSSSFESSVGLIALGNLAAFVNAGDVAAGLDTWNWFSRDVLDAPLPIKGGRLQLERANALARRVDTSGLRRLGP
ncbi:MAG TPA: o-succinylbenzoate synthase [Candidatus Hydrogenedentes bacterium]|nr:o-succinylbenzoate synthase [Candidatus Hydrogenedentota bacterium]